MIPIYTESTSTVKEWSHVVERCVFCGLPTRTWHENTNNPVCKECAKTKKVGDIPEDHGQLVRRLKRNGKFDREDLVRAN